VRPVPIGSAARFEIVPDRSHSAAMIGNIGVEAVSTPSLVALLEQASELAIRFAYDAGEASVGTRIALDHQRAAYPGTRLVVAARVDRVEGNRVGFAVEAEQAERTIIRGEHERRVVSLARFHGRSAASPKTPAPARTIAFWFDFHSPWCWLASTRIGALAARHGAELQWRPVHLPRLIDAIDGRRVLEANARFLHWYKQDLADWAALYGVTARYHPNFPLRPARALRAAIRAAEAGVAEAWVTRVMRAYWAEAADISDLAVLARLATELGLEPEPLIAAAGSDIFKAKLESNLAEAIATGLFGVPAFVVDGKVFFGNDRLMLLDRYLGGDALDRFAAGLAAP
jgi:2-hydroxychromene-2-carboxylate isomerase/predicted thioesterase